MRQIWISTFTKAPLIVLTSLLFLLHYPVLAQEPETGQPEIKVTFLGTNGPMPEPGRVGASTLVEANGQILIVDAGLNITQQLVESGVSLSQVKHLFLTHFHSDHIAGLPGLWSTTWLRRRNETFHVYGPVGTEVIAQGVLSYFAKDIPIRLNGPERLPPGGNSIQAHELESTGVIYEADGVKVTAFEVDHGIDVGLAFGYRIDYAGMSVVLSGDTTYNQNVIEFGRNSDLLIHEVMGVTQELLDAGRYRSGVLEVHTTPEQAGQVFDEAGPRMAAYTHIIYGRQAGFQPMSQDELVERTRTHYSGELIVPKQLDVVTVTADSVSYSAQSE